VVIQECRWDELQQPPVQWDQSRASDNHFAMIEITKVANEKINKNAAGAVSLIESLALR
jgi:hypothetical protein